MCLWDVAAWRVLFPREHERRVHFGELFWIRLAGEGLNNVTPVIDVGGEPLKAHLVVKRFRVAPASALASVVVARTSIMISEAVFLFFGTAFSFHILRIPVPQRMVLSGILCVICLVFAAFLMLQQKGAFRRLNPEIGRFYSAHGDRFWGAVALNTLGWLSGGVETWFFCRLLGLDISLFQSVVLESFLQLVRTGSFFIPMSLGTQEGGLAFFTNAMGYDPVSGLALSLLKRARQLLWTAAGFGVWGVYRYLEARNTTVAVRPEVLSFDTELDRLIHRPIANFIARAFSRTPITPNQLTVCSLIPAFLSCAFFSLAHPLASCLGLLFFYLWSVLDHADGSLARMKQQTSEWGKALDDFCDEVASTAVFCGVFWGLEGFWNAYDRAAMERVFYPLLIFNLVSNFWLVHARRRVRQHAVKKESISRAHLWKQKFLDGLAGRDAVYGVLLLVIAAHAWGPSCWPLYTFTMGTFLVGMFLIATVSFFESAKAWSVR